MKDKHQDDTIPLQGDSDCTFHFNPNYCPAGALPNKEYVIQTGEDCVVEHETSCVSPVTPETEECIDFLPCLTLEKKGCHWYNTVGVPSTPPKLPCAPHKVGRGQFGGGVARWTLSMPEKATDILKHCNPWLHTYKQTDWDSILNLNTHPEWQSNLVVRRERGEQNMTASEFLNLASKMQDMMKLLDEYNDITNIDSTNIGIGLIVLPKVNATDPDTYGISALVNGQATGNPLPLVSQVDGTGTVTGLSFPVPT